jgi:DNA-binding LacI/PurR family transcriptional regulator
MSSIDDVAKLAGVSTATVSAVVNGQDIVKPRTRKKVLDAIRTLNYEPNFYAQTLARGRSTIIGIIISDIVNPFFAEIAQIVQQNAIRRGYQVLISVTEFSVDRLGDAIKYMIGMRIDGILIMTSEMDDKVLEIVRERKIPVVFEDVGTVDATTSNLRIDYEGGIYRAVRCLVELGHEKILFVQNPPISVQPEQLFSHRLRAEAFQAAIDRFPNLTAHKFAGSGGRTPFQAGVECARQILQRFEFTGVVASADPHAVGLLRGFQRAGKKVPDDISIIGFDNSPFCEYTDPQLTSVSISRNEIAESAVEALIGMMEQGRPGVEIHIPTELIMRESVGKPRKP